MTEQKTGSNEIADDIKGPLTRKQKIITFAIICVIAVVGMVISGIAGAYTTPATGTPGYELYDLVMNKGLDGPIGFVFGAWLLINAGGSIGSNPKMAALQGIGGGMIIKAEAIANTLGYLV